MAFKLITDQAGSCVDFGDDSTHTFNEHGLLVTVSDGVRRVYSPNAWQYLEESSPMKARNSRTVGS